MKHSIRSIIFCLILALTLVPCLAFTQAPDELPAVPEVGGAPEASVEPTPIESQSESPSPSTSPTDIPTSNPTDEPSCGDGRCEDEDCETCEVDCGSCTCAESCEDGICCNDSCLTGASSCPGDC